MTAMTDDRAGRSTSGAGLGFALLSAASFGASGGLAGGLLGSGWSPAAIVTCRVVIAALVLAPPALMTLRGRWWLLSANAGLVVTYGLVAVAGCQLAYFTAVDRLPVAIALLLEYVAPVAVMGWLWARHGQRPGGVTLLGTCAAAIGLLLVLDVFSAGAVDGLGVCWALVAMLGCAAHFLLSARQDNGLPPIVMAAAGLVVAGLTLVAAGLVGLVSMSASSDHASYAGTTLPWWVPIVTLGVVTAAVAYVAGIAASRRLGARLASFAALMEVLFGLLFAWLLLDQLPHPVQLLGGVFVLAGVVLVKLGEPRPESGLTDLLPGQEDLLDQQHQ